MGYCEPFALCRFFRTPGSLETASRGYETTPKRQERFEREIAYFQARHKDILETGDPDYNPNLTFIYEDFRYGGGPADSASPWGVYRKSDAINVAV